ncbi:uncharacterized protein LOC121374995 [Gigantopelta aegis]|uniref:uncharacterized protein LOC121374995 n=1 Tax=Gigantopelta aegis TaxID=1735272 RepID=UPI001B88A32E|nr:uncharacterized protein LOC121374995 [Gigantopelta aegis]
MPIEMVDLEQVVKDYIRNDWLEDRHRKEADMDNAEIKWDHVQFTHYPAKYTYDNGDSNEEDANGEMIKTGKLSTPGSHIIFTAYFTNNTSTQQTHTLTTERRTESTCTVSLSKSYTMGGSFNIRLTPPNPIIEANAGFKGELSKMSGLNDTFSKEMTWSVNSQIIVPKQSCTKADLVIREDNFDGHFTLRTKLEGKVVYTVWDKKKNHLSSGRLDVKNIFKSCKSFQVENGVVYFTSEGNCKCRFGVEQKMNLTELPLDRD